MYLEDKEKGEHRRVKDAALREAIRKDYWREIDVAVSHPLPDGPGPAFMRDLQEQAKKLAATKGFPPVIRRNDPLMGRSCGHWYDRVYYHLLWPNGPAGYSRDTEPAVYILDEEKGEYRAVTDEALCKAIAAHHWQEIDEQNVRMMTMPGPMQKIVPIGNMGRLQTGFTGMMDGSYMTPQPPKPGPVSEAWTCPGCGKAGNTGRFCPEYGGGQAGKTARLDLPPLRDGREHGKILPRLRRGKAGGKLTCLRPRITPKRFSGTTLSWAAPTATGMQGRITPCSGAITRSGRRPPPFTNGAPAKQKAVL